MSESFQAILGGLLKRFSWVDMSTPRDLIDQAASYGISVDEAMVAQFARYIEKAVGDAVTEYAFTMYRVMDESSLFLPDDPGFVNALFLQWVMGASPDQSMMPMVLDEAACRVRLSEAYEQWGIAGVALPTLCQRLTHARINVAGHLFKASDVGLLNQVLAVLGSRYRLATKAHRKWRAFIWGVATEQKVGPFRVMTMVSEQVRTPNLSLDNPAFTLDHLIVIRREVCQQVVAYKWLPLVDDPAIQGPDKVSAVSVAIRRRALSYLPGRDKVSLLSCLETMLHHNVLYHELGHPILYEMGCEAETVSIAMGLKSVGVTAFDGVLEWLADMAPRCKTGWGGLHHVATQSDPRYALASFYAYLSDVYFFDTQASPFYFYSAMILTVMVRMMAADGSVDFQRLRGLTDASSEGFSTGLYHAVCSQLTRHMAAVKALLHSATYEIEGREYGFSYLEAHEKKQLALVSNRIGHDSYHFLQPAWTNYLCYFRAFSPQYEQLNPLLETFMTEIRTLMAEWADMGLDPGTDGSYQAGLITRLSQYLTTGVS